MDKVTEGLPTKSAKIRALYKRGASRSEIATYLNIRYQHVRNVLVAPGPQSSADNYDGDGGGKPPSMPEARDSVERVRPLSIDEAKRGLAERFGVPTDRIEITIRG